MTTLLSTLQQHIDYNYWGHRRVWHYVLMLSDEQFTQPLDYSQGAIRDQIIHTIHSEDVWLSRILDEPFTTYTAHDFPDRPAIRLKWDALEAKMRQTTANFTEIDILRPVIYKNSKGDEFNQTVLQILLHVVNHGTDHRAQMLAMMHTLGAQTVEQDLIHYLRTL